MRYGTVFAVGDTASIRFSRIRVEWDTPEPGDSEWSIVSDEAFGGRPKPEQRVQLGERGYITPAPDVEDPDDHDVASALDSIEAEIDQLAGLFGPGHPTARKELAGLRRELVAVRRWLFR